MIRVGTINLYWQQKAAMTLLTDHEIESLITGLEILEPYSADQLNPCSYDVTLGHTLILERPGFLRCLWDPNLRKAVTYNRRWLLVDISDSCPEHPFILRPGDFVLGCTEEVLKLPAWTSAQFVLKSSRAREGYEHSEAGWIDAGFCGRVTLELSNVLRRHSLPLWRGMRIGQIKFFSHAVPTHPYGSTDSSHYQNSWGTRISWQDPEQ